MGNYFETCLKRPLKNRQTKVLGHSWSKVLQNAPRGHFQSSFEWPLKTGLTVYELLMSSQTSGSYILCPLLSLLLMYLGSLYYK